MQRPDIAALELLYLEQHQRIFRTCLRYLNNVDDAEDAAQETFIRASSHLEQLRHDPGSYLWMTARNICLDELRRRRRTTVAGLVGGPDPGDAQQDVVDLWLLRHLWQRLTEGQRGLLLDRFAGLSYEEIASKRGSSVAAVARALTRARRLARDVADGLPAVVAPLFLLRRVVRRMADVGRPRATEMVGLAYQPAVALLSIAAAVAVLSLPGSASPPRSGKSTASAVHALRPPSTAGVVAARPNSPGSSPLPFTVPPRGASHSPVASLPAPQSSVDLASTAGVSSRQQDADFYNATQSPAYLDDHTAFVSGSGMCAGSCPVIFRTTDGGTTWQRLPAIGLDSGGSIAGPVMLPSDFPRNRTLFVDGEGGLQRSDNGGLTFMTVLPVVGPAAISPPTGDGDSMVALATPSQVLLYDVGTGAVVAGPLLPVGALPAGVVFDGADRLVITANMGVRGDAEVIVCQLRGTCTITHTVFGEAPMYLVPGRTAEGNLVMYSERHVYSLGQGGRLQQLPVVPVANGRIVAVTLTEVAGITRFVVASWGVDPNSQYVASALESVDGGRTFTPLDGDYLTRMALHQLLELPDGRLLATLGMADADGFGVRCSLDHGHTWKNGC